jgi:ParB/RepB/Spo0J family partition protein
MADLATSVDVTAGGSPAPGTDRPELARVPLDRIRLHPLNLRRELRDLDELADSVRQHGLLEPVILVPDPESPEDGDQRYLLVAGHRRHAACVMARHDPVEAIIRLDLDGDGAQVLAMLTENGPRDDLTPIEEAHGLQLALQLNQLTPAKLAKRLGKPRSRVDSRIALTRLPEQVQDQVHARQISLTEAEAMVEFARDTEAMQALQGAVGKPSFQYRLEQQRHMRERRQQRAEVLRKLRETGLRVIERPSQYPWESVEKPIANFIDPGVEVGPDDPPVAFTPDTHAAACTFHAAFLSDFSAEPTYVCTNPAEAGHQVIRRSPAAVAPPAGGAEVDVAADEAERLRLSEEEQQRRNEAARVDAARQDEVARAEAERQEALAVAARLRRSFLGALLSRRAKGQLQAVLQLILTEHFYAWIDQADLEDVQELTTLIDAQVPEAAESDDPVDVDALWDDILTGLRAALDSRRSPEAIAGGLLAMVGHDREWALAQGHGWRDPACRRYLDFLIAQGWGPTEIEQELLAESLDDD